MGILSTLLILMAAPVATLGQEPCFDETPVVDQTVVWHWSAPVYSDFYLPSQGYYGPFDTRAAAHMMVEGEAGVISFDYELPPGMVSLPYTVHRLEIETGDFRHSEDFTRGCTDPGLSFFPGEKTDPVSFKVPAPQGPLPVRIRIWGHL